MTVYDRMREKYALTSENRGTLDTAGMRAAVDEFLSADGYRNEYQAHGPAHLVLGDYNFGRWLTYCIGIVDGLLDYKDYKQRKYTVPRELRELRQFLEWLDWVQKEEDEEAQENEK